MGEYADMILDGIICQRCSSVIEEPIGVPAYCEDCLEELGDDFDLERKD